jgi:hypothetical protein
MQERLAPNDWLKKWTHAEVNAGADIIVMHGAPLLHGVEIYHGRPIFYDLGNFIYNVPPTLTYIDEPMNCESVVAYIQLQGKNLGSISFQPIALNNVGDGQPDIHNEYANNRFLDTRGLPSSAKDARAGYILQRLAAASKPFGTVVEIKGDSDSRATRYGFRTGLKTRPSFMTSTIFRTLRTFAAGSALSTTRSAAMPVAIVPRSAACPTAMALT